MSEWTQQRRDDYAAGYEFARQELLANGQWVEWCKRHNAEAVRTGDYCWFVSPAADSLGRQCRIVSRLLSVYPNGPLAWTELEDGRLVPDPDGSISRGHR